MAQDINLAQNSLFVKSGDSYVKVCFDDIKWVKSELNYLSIVCEKKQYMIRSSFVNFLNHVPEGKFLKTHKSYLVNVDRIEVLNHRYIQIGDEKIPLSRNYHDTVYGSFIRI